MQRLGYHIATLVLVSTMLACTSGGSAPPVIRPVPRDSVVWNIIQKDSVVPHIVTRDSLVIREIPRDSIVFHIIERDSVVPRFRDSTVWSITTRDSTVWRITTRDSVVPVRRDSVIIVPRDSIVWSIVTRDSTIWRVTTKDSIIWRIVTRDSTINVAAIPIDTNHLSVSTWPRGFPDEGVDSELWLDDGGPATTARFALIGHIIKNPDGTFSGWPQRQLLNGSYDRRVMVSCPRKATLREAMVCTALTKPGDEPPPITTGLRIDDSAPGMYPGEMNVWNGTQHIGRLYSASYNGRSGPYYAYRDSPQGMLRGPVSYPDSMSAMQALVGASWPLFTGEWTEHTPEPIRVMMMPTLPAPAATSTTRIPIVKDP